MNTVVDTITQQLPLMGAMLWDMYRRPARKSIYQRSTRTRVMPAQVRLQWHCSYQHGLVRFQRASKWPQGMVRLRTRITNKVRYR